MFWIVFITKVITMADTGNAIQRVQQSGFRSRPYTGPIMPRFPSSTLSVLAEPPRPVETDTIKAALARI